MSQNTYYFNVFNDYNDYNNDIVLKFAVPSDVKSTFSIVEDNIIMQQFSSNEIVRKWDDE
jgi:hypothetical protein